MLKSLSWPVASQPVPVRRHAVSKYQTSAKSWYAWVSYGLIAVNVGLLLSYFAGVNKYTSSGYEIKSLRTRISALTEENKKLTVKVSEQNSMTQLQNEIAGNSLFVPANNPVYVQPNQFSQR